MALAASVSAHAAPASDSAEVGELVVTGSRAIRDGAQAPTPVTVVSAEQLQSAAPGTIASALNQLPVFRGSSTPSSGGLSATGPNAGSFLNLRNLGPQRTLVLVDGRRAAPSAVNGATDTNVLPQELVKRVDVVTGGASAAYGSDAVAGVVNFVLDTGFKGLRGSVQAGQSRYSDNGSMKATLTGGTHFADDRGRLVVSAAYFNADGVDSTLARPFGRLEATVVRDPANSAQSIVVTNYHSTFASRGGVVFGGAGLGAGALQFGPGGTVLPFTAGSIVNGVQVGGQGVLGQQNLISDVESQSYFSHAEFDLTPELTAYAEGSFGQVHNRYPQVGNFHIPGFNAPTILSGNPFIPASIQAIMKANNLPGFQLGRIDFDMPTSTADALNNTVNAVAGFRYQASGGLRLEGYWEHGENRQRIRTDNNLNYGRFFAAIDAVVDPVSGKTVCNVTLTNPSVYPGCVPLNLIGEGSPTAAAIAYVQGTAYYRAVLKQDVAALTLSGSPFATSAGEVSMAAGLEYRREAVAQVTDQTSVTPVSPTGLRAVPATVLAGAGGWQLTNPQPLGGDYDIREAFVEVDAPLARDMPFAKALNLNGAIRYTDYSTSGGVTTWKLGATWKPFDDLRLRIAKSRDIRAPNLSELFSGSVQGQTAVRDTINNVAANVVFSQVGNPKLQPEEADTFTVGILYQPSAAPGLSLAIDYFNIDLSGVITSLTPQKTIDECAAGSVLQCSNLIFSNPTARTGLVRVLTPQLNLASRKTSGYDFEASYQTDASRLWSRLDGQFTVRALATYLDEYVTTTPGGAPVDSAGVVGTSSNPRLAATLSGDYRRGPLDLYVQVRRIGKGRFQAGTEAYSPALADNTVPAATYVDTTVNYRLEAAGGEFQLFATINNLLDEKPPILPTGSFNVNYPTNPSVYDVVGRYYTAGVRFRF